MYLLDIEMEVYLNTKILYKPHYAAIKKQFFFHITLTISPWAF